MPQVEALTLDKSYRELSIHKTTYILLNTITGLITFIRFYWVNLY
jgi:hypothetical protein